MNFNVNFNILLSKYIVHPLVKIKKDVDNNKMHSKTVKKYMRGLFCGKYYELRSTVLRRNLEVV